MKKILFTLLSTLFLSYAFSQTPVPIYLRGDFTTIPWDASLITSARGAANTYTLNNLSGIHEFKFGTSNWGANWGANSIANVSQTVSTNSVAAWYSFGGNASYNFTAGKYYTFNLVPSDNLAGIIETATAPVSITTVTQTPIAGAVTNAPVTINISASSTPSATEKVYVRYSTTFFNTSSIVEATMSGSSGTATIPTLPSGSLVLYYTYTSVLSKAAIDAAVLTYGQGAHDVSALNINNSKPDFSGGAYAYIVGNYSIKGVLAGSTIMTHPNNFYGLMNTAANTAASNRHAYIYSKSALGIFGVKGSGLLQRMGFLMNQLTPNVKVGTSNLKLYLLNTITNAWTNNSIIDWDNYSSFATKVWEGDPAKIINGYNRTDKYVEFYFNEQFPYGGDNLILLVEYTQTAATTTIPILWSISDKTSVPEFFDNQLKQTSSLGSVPSNILSPTGDAFSSSHPIIFFYGAVLPVELTKFEGKSTKQGNILTWQTASEKSSKEYVIEKSNNGKIFHPIGIVKAAGNSISTLSYEFNDNKPSFLDYYRLRIVDLDGKETFSKTITLQNSKNNEVKLYPNPVTDDLFIESEEVINTINVFNTLGQIVKKVEKVNEKQFTLNMSDLQVGIYYVRINNQEGRKIIMQ
jgi:Secretion system C-terminal sorting domain